MREVHHFIGGAQVTGTSGRFGDIYNPNIGEVQAKVALATTGEMDAAVQAAANAFPAWAATNPQRRARVMFEFKRLLEANMDELAELLSSEHGKVVADSRGDVQRGIDVVEFACGIPHLQKGEYTEGAGPGIDVYSMRQPLGVVAAGSAPKAMFSKMEPRKSRLSCGTTATRRRSHAVGSARSSAPPSSTAPACGA